MRAEGLLLYNYVQVHNLPLCWAAQGTWTVMISLRPLDFVLDLCIVFFLCIVIILLYCIVSLIIYI